MKSRLRLSAARFTVAFPTWAGLLAVGLLAALARAQSDSISSQSPIRYGTSRSDDAVARLQKQIDAGRVKLSREDGHGYLESVLKLLKVPVSSQTLVFSKTSFQ